MLNQKDLREVIRDGLNNRFHNQIQDKNCPLIHAAVLIPLFCEEAEYKVLFTMRTSRVEHHKGQISFPGGAVDKEDGSLKETALREADEEIGLLPDDVEILGRVDDVRTMASNFIIHPFVGVIPHPYNFRINSKEVERLIPVPLNVFLEDTYLDKRHTIEYEGLTYTSPAFLYQGEVIWGATARIMENLIDIIRKKLDLPAGMQ